MSVLAASAVDALVSDLASEHPDIEVRPSSATTVEYLDDAATRLAPRRSRTRFGPTVALPTTTEQVRQTRPHCRTTRRRSRASRGGQRTVRRCVRERRPARHLDRRGSPGSSRSRRSTRSPSSSQVSSTPNSTRTSSTVRPLLRARPGKLADLVDRRQHRHRTRADCGARSTASPGSAVLALDVVLADGSLISIGHRSIKGVTGLDLVLAVSRVRGHTGHHRRCHGAAPADSGGPAHRHGVLRHDRGRSCGARRDHRLA